MSNISDIYEKQIHQAIDDWGRTLTITYHVDTSCPTCRSLSLYDPISKESRNASCSTCDGKYYYPLESTLEVKGVLKSFIGDMKSIDYALNKFGYVPDHDARITCWLDDVLVDEDSANGASYLDLDYISFVSIDGKDYKIKTTSRTGVHDLKVIIASLKEVKNEN